MSLIVPTIDELVAADHPYRPMLRVLDFGKLTRPLGKLYSDLGRGGYPIEQGFRCLLLQYIEDLSDRQAERFIRENLAAKLFCGFELLTPTPEFSYFSRLRSRIGLAELTKLYNRVRDSLQGSGMIREVFTFVDSSQLLSRVNVWEARDRALADRENEEKDDSGNRKLNNKNVGKYSSDSDARFGCKGKDKFWFGYKSGNCRIGGYESWFDQRGVGDAGQCNGSSSVAGGLSGWWDGVCRQGIQRGIGAGLFGVTGVSCGGDFEEQYEREGPGQRSLVKRGAHAV